MTRRRTALLAAMLGIVFAARSAAAQGAGGAAHASPASCPMHGVSIYRLIATSERFDGCRVSVLGFLHLEHEGDGLYPHRADVDANLVTNAIGIVESLTIKGQHREFGDHYVLIEGTFHGKDGNAAIDEITRAELWKSRAELRRDLAHGFRTLQRPRTRR